jgi:hypothetical protein
MVVWPAATAGALRAPLGSAGLVWAWCDPAALSGRRPPLGGGGGFLPCGYGATVSCPGDVVFLYFLGHAPVFMKQLMMATPRPWWRKLVGGEDRW